MYDYGIFQELMEREALIEKGKSITPKEIYDYLDKRIWKQEAAQKSAAMVMWKALNGIRENVMFCGLSGCGKTEIRRSS